MEQQFDGTYKQMSIKKLPKSNTLVVLVPIYFRFAETNEKINLTSFKKELYSKT